MLLLLQVLTNDVFVASNHRVLRSTAHDRYSRAFFFNPVYSADIQPLPSLAASECLRGEGSGVGFLFQKWRLYLE